MRPNCAGKGDGPGLTPLEKECPGCDGSVQIEGGTVERQSYANCHGTGRYPPPESL